jgi:ergothioneine biosynthesis protein EgtB
LKTRYTQVRKETLKRCEKLLPEDMVVQAEVFGSPVKWHLGHTTWFFETFILKRFDKNYKVLSEDHNFIFNSYYESIGERVNRNRRGMLFRPPVSEIYAYRQYVDGAILALLEHNSDEELLQLMELGLQHEQQHQELIITDTKYIFAQNPLLPVWDAEKTLERFRLPIGIEWLPVTEGVYEIGYKGENFCFDNELNPHKQYIQPLEMMNRPVSNGEYLEFVEAGGYENPLYWLSEGWDWVKSENITHPMYWFREKESYSFFHLDGLKPLDPQLPLMHVSYYEAEAFARWKNMRLPTEFEWEAAARIYPGQFNTCVWEWTGSAYLPYPGFRVAEGAVGEYNGKFMVNQMVLRGKSLATPEGHSRITYRNFFSANLQWQFSGIRLVK